MTGNQIDSVERASPDILAGLILIFAALGRLIAAAHHRSSKRENAMNFRRAVACGLILNADCEFLAGPTRSKSKYAKAPHTSLIGLADPIIKELFPASPKLYYYCRLGCRA